VKNIREASPEDLEKAIGRAKAALVLRFFADSGASAIKNP
jgi:hypothetical protein